MNNTKTIRELTVRLYIFARDRLTSAFPGIYSIYCRVVDGIIAQVQFLHFAVCQIKFSALDFPYAPFALWRYFLKTPNTNIDTHIHTHKHTYTYRHGHAFIFRDFSSSFEFFTWMARSGEFHAKLQYIAIDFSMTRRCEMFALLLPQQWQLIRVRCTSRYPVIVKVFTEKEI